jgi:cardiolipin synthase
MLALIISLLWSAYIIALILWVIWQKRAPAATLGWLVTLGALPYVGFIIYYFFGPLKLKRRRLRRLAAQRALAWYTRVTPTNAFSFPDNALLHLFKLGMNASGLPPGTCQTAQILVDGSETFAAIFDEIRNAKEHINLEYYIVDPDRTGTALRDLLIEKAREGVAVRLLVDGFGSKRLDADFLKPLIDAGAKVAVFHPVRFPAFRFTVFRARPVINLRNHRKIVIVDHWVGFTGGINITDEENDNFNLHAFHDCHLKITGEAVRSLQQIFWEDWYYVTGEEPPEPPPGVPHVGKHIVHVLSSGPDTEWAPIKRVYLAAISAAQTRLWLTTPYFVPDEASLSALTNAALRGVDVRILVPRKSNSPLATLAARSYFDELTRAGVIIYEYGDGMLHSKTMLMDDNIAFIGTVNFDQRSFLLNFEVCAMVHGDEIARQLAAQFEEDLAAAQPVLKQREVSRIGYMGEAIARLVGPLL